MKSFRSIFKLSWVLLLFFFLFLPSCNSFIMSRTDPFYKSFYEKTSLIMTDAEDKKYKTLPDETSKKEFINEFWAKRDIDPTTDENEGMLIFKERIAYCNEWFWSFSKSRGTATSSDQSKDMGWKTDRGRIYIVLGPPDYINYESSARWETERYAGAHRNANEAWYYGRFELIVLFDRGRLLNLRMSELFVAMNEAKLEWIRPDYREDPNKLLQYDVEFIEDHVKLKVYPGNISFKAQENMLLLKLKINIEIFHEQSLLDNIEKIETLELGEEEVLEIDNFEFKIPFQPAEKGKYTVNVKLQDLYAMYISTYKKTFSFKYERQ